MEKGRAARSEENVFVPVMQRARHCLRERINSVL